MLVSLKFCLTVPVLLSLPSHAQGYPLLPALCSCGAPLQKHAALIESDPDSSFFQHTLADAPLFFSPPVVDNWPFSCDALLGELWPRCVGLSPFLLYTQDFIWRHAEQEETANLHLSTLKCLMLCSQRARKRAFLQPLSMKSQRKCRYLHVLSFFIQNSSVHT